MEAEGFSPLTWAFGRWLHATVLRDSGTSMRPILESGTIILYEPATRESDVHVGQIILRRGGNPFGDSKVTAHMVYEVSRDERGWYVLTRGINNRWVDDGRVRFSDVFAIVRAVLY